jgi:predicted CopG family antitoxin
MKTVTLTEDAYERLLAWKTSPRDSFSKVVLKVVPKRGTLGQMLEDVRQLPPLSDRQAKVMEETSAWGRNPAAHREPWTS